MNEQNLGMIIDLLEEVKQGNINSQKEQKTIAERIEAIETVIERGLDLSDDVKMALANRNELTTKQLNAIAKALLQTMADGFDGLKSNAKTEDRPCYYFFDKKPWAKWVGLALTLVMFCLSVGLFAYNLQSMQRAEEQELRYRYLRMRGRADDKEFLRIDSLMQDDKAKAIIREQVLDYEANLQRQAELLLRKQHLDEEQESLKKKLKRE